LNGSFFLVILLVMHTEDALGRKPAFAFVFYKFVHALVADKLKILNFTHTVFCSVPLIQVFQTSARKFFAFKTKLAFSFLAQSNLTESAGFWLVTFSEITTVARVFLTKTCVANRAIHPARSN